MPSVVATLQALVVELRAVIVDLRAENVDLHPFIGQSWGRERAGQTVETLGR